MFCAGLALNGVIPLFPLYEAAFGLTTTDQTLVFAIYALTLIPALLVLGPLSDAIGRKRILLPALGTFVVASTVFAFAGGLGMLLVGRSLQGVANGAMWGTAAAMIRDLMPDERRADASLVVSVTLTASIAVGVVAFGVLGALTDSVVVPWLGHAVLMVVAGALVATTPETVTRVDARRIRVRLALPRGYERSFTRFLAPLTVSTVSLGGIVMALTPEIIGRVQAAAVSATSGVSLATFVTIATVIQLATRRVPAFRACGWGAGIVVVGAAAVLAGTSARALPVVLGGMGVMGIGSGLAFRGTLALAEYMSDEANRASVISAYNVVMYVSMSLPALAAGALVDLADIRWAVACAAGLAVLLAVPAVVVGTRHLPVDLRG